MTPKMKIVMHIFLHFWSKLFIEENIEERHHLLEEQRHWKGAPSFGKAYIIHELLLHIRNF